MVELITQLTGIVLTVATLVFVFQVIIQKTTGQLSVSSFSTFLVIVLIGWMSTEVVTDVTGQTLGQLGRIAHFLVMILFATAMTVQLRHSSKA